MYREKDHESSSIGQEDVQQLQDPQTQRRCQGELQE
jgi:hypothetical protein